MSIEQVSTKNAHNNVHLYIQPGAVPYLSKEVIVHIRENVSFFKDFLVHALVVVVTSACAKYQSMITMPTDFRFESLWTSILSTRTALRI